MINQVRRQHFDNQNLACFVDGWKSMEVDVTEQLGAGKTARKELLHGL